MQHALIALVPSHYLFVLCLLVTQAHAEFIVSHRSPEAEGDSRQHYNNELLILALEKTKTKYGAYKLQAIPAMTTPRLLSVTTSNTYQNLIFELTYEDKFTSKGDLIYINFPIDLGIVSYRVCFVNPAIKDELKQIRSIDQLKKYSIGQGIGWSDVEILRANGFHVNEFSNYGNIFKMVAAGRIDLFLRGANELRSEYNTFKNNMNLIYDDSFVIFYPLPRFFYIAAENKLAKERIEEGLKIAYHDGSLKKLWRKEYGESIQFAKLKQRKIFRLKNPLIKNLPDDYQKYLFDPFHE
jgi:ABC-type amino acid transport substrate-binding protein